MDTFDNVDVDIGIDGGRVAMKNLCRVIFTLSRDQWQGLAPNLISLWLSKRRTGASGIQNS